MRILVTGATGFIGAHAVARLQADGHQVAVLIRSRDRLTNNTAAAGAVLEQLDVHVGDMTDADAVSRSLDGADAVIHAAAVVAALNRADASATIAANVDGARTVIDSALEVGCRRVVYLSSVAAVYTTKAAVITPDLPPAVEADSPYTRSKALAEQWVRGRQADGAPITNVYPGGVTGPAAGDAFGDVAEGFVSMLKSGFVALNDGAFGILDVRDLAAALSAAVTADSPGPQRFMAGGVFTTLNEIGAILRQLTGRRMPVLPTPGAVFRGLGHVVDGIRRVIDFDTVFTAEAMDLLTLARPTDDTAVHEQLGVDYRKPIESIEPMLRDLYAAGRLSPRQVGALAERPANAAG